MPTLTKMLAASLWSRSLTAEQMQRAEAEMIERCVPAGEFVCRKGEEVEHWIGVIDGLVKMASRDRSVKGRPTHLAPAGALTSRA